MISGICKSCGNAFVVNSAGHETCHWCVYYKKNKKPNPFTQPGYPGTGF